VCERRREQREGGEVGVEVGERGEGGEVGSEGVVEWEPPRRRRGEHAKRESVAK
jgi:hypothetical protein